MTVGDRGKGERVEEIERAEREVERGRARQASKPPEAMNILQWGSVTDFKAALLS